MNRNMRKPIKGEILYSLNIGNSARDCEQVLTKVEVVSVGRKYFKASADTTRDWMSSQYHLDNWYECSNYSAGSRLYESPQEWEDDKECRELHRFIRNAFGGSGYSHIKLEALRTIKGIIEANT